MGLFSKKPADSKARIEELKKKIQAEQAAYANAVAANPATPQAPPPTPSAPPAPQQPAPQPVMQAPQQQMQAPQATYQQQPAYQQPVYAQPIYDEPAPRRRQDLVEEMFEDDTMDEIKTGIILDLGEGMSLNLPIRSKMRLDEFLHIADKVRELQRLQR